MEEKLKRLIETAMNNSVLYAFLYMHARDPLAYTLQEALIDACLAMVEINEDLTTDLLSMLSARPPIGLN